MKYVNLGSTGLQVSKLCLGCMTFGYPSGVTTPGPCPKPESRQLIRQLWIWAINFFR